ncbi:hypothetical protein [Streptomyces sp. NPDC058424]|uniref:hypothetical protein n=1 Tax=Streptomyces sp. NPDC058424 TaxID=3346491 RepID=UPI00364ACE22
MRHSTDKQTNARHAAIDQDHDQVVTARIADGQLVWKVYPVDKVPDSPKRRYFPNPADL